MKFEFKILRRDFPKMWQCQNSGFVHMRIFESPFCNCQTFTIGSARDISSMDEKTVENFVAYVVDMTGRRQAVIDLQFEISERVILKLRPHLSDEPISTPYTSTNGSNMIMHILKFNSKFLDQ